MARRYSNLMPILVDLETPGLVSYIAVLTKRDGTVRDLMEEIERTYTRLFSQYSAEEFPITSLRRRVYNGKQMLLPAWYPIEPLLSDYDSVIIVAAIPQYQSSSLVVECSTTPAFSEQTHSAGGILANSSMIDPNISSNEAVCQRKRKLDDNVVAESESVNEENEQVNEPCDQESVNFKHKRGKRGKRRRKEKEDAIAIAEMKEDSKFLAERTQQEMAGKGNEGRSVSNRRERAEGSEAQSETELSLKSDFIKMGKEKSATSNKSCKSKIRSENKESDEQADE
eukprot:gene9801-10806_t